MAKKSPGPVGVQRVSVNRRARRDYTIIETLEAGIALTGSEVKSLRRAQASIEESYADVTEDGVVLHNCHIPPYAPSTKDHAHTPKRPRRLLLHRRQIRKLIGAVQRQGYTLIALDIHFNDRGLAKLSLGLARGKKLYDKRADDKSRDWDRRRARLLRQNN